MLRQHFSELWGKIIFENVSGTSSLLYDHLSARWVVQDLATRAPITWKSKKGLQLANTNWSIIPEHQTKKENIYIYMYFLSVQRNPSTAW